MADEGFAAPVLGDEDIVEAARQLIALGRPDRALRLIRQSRPAWVKDWSEEWTEWVMVAAQALEALRRPMKSLELYRIAARNVPEAAARAAELERQLG